MHLELPRREEYRRARQALLAARGEHTIALDRRLLSPRAAAGDTLADLPQATDPNPSPFPFALVQDDKLYPLRLGVNSVGRLEDNDVVVDDPHISRRHCAILVHAGSTCEVQDTASKNGTYVNGAKINCPTRLQPGDEIRMCDLRLTLQALNQAGS